MATSTPPRPVRLPELPVPRAQRRRERLRGLVAGLFLLLLVVGVPVGLVLGVGAPDQLTLPDSDWVTGSLDATKIIQIFSLVVWVAWLQFVFSVVVEWRAERRGATRAARIPLGGGSQALARRLVASVLLLAGVATLTAHGSAAPSRGVPQPMPAATAPAVTGGGQTADAVRPDAPAPHAAPAHVAAAHHVGTPTVHHTAQTAPRIYYEVKAHVGRHYDTLWGIADRYLGNGVRYKEIFALNKDRLQPDGGRLTKPDLIRPGWVLRMPADASGAGLRVEEPLPVAVPRPVAPKAAPHHTAPHTAHHTAPAHHTAVPQPAAAPHAVPPTEQVAPTSGVTVQHLPPAATTVPGVPSPSGDRLPQDLLGGSLIAAGLLVGLRRRRGAFGHDAEPTLAAAEQALRLAADVPMAQFVDQALRMLSADLTAQGRALPEVYAAFVDDDALTLRFSPAEPLEPPAPWLVSDDQRSWTIELGALDGRDPVDTPAPYPGLVVLGTVERRRVLLDLEAAPGIVSIGGDARTARDIAVSVAVELATNVWSDDVRVTMVGFGDELSGLAPVRLRHVVSLAEALDAVESRWSALRATESDAGAVLRGRQQRHGGGAWRPDFLVLSGPPAAAEAQRLAALVADQRRPVAVLVVGDLQDARWRFVAREDASLDTGVLGIELDAQLLPVEEYRPLVELATSADRAALTAPAVLDRLRGPERPDPGGAAALPLLRPVQVPATALRLDQRMPVEVRLLGPLSVLAPGALDPTRRELAGELLSFVALQDKPVHPNVLRAAIWPRGASDDVVEATIGHVQQWLGVEADGRPRLRLEDGLWSLADSVRVDWDVFRVLVAHSASYDVIEGEEATLTKALSLVRGPFLGALPAGRYSWLATLPAEHAMAAAVVAAAHRVAELAGGRADYAAAAAAARTGLAAVPTSELLWRDLLAAVAASGDRLALEETAHALGAALGRNRGREAGAAETDALLAELLPGFRVDAA